MRLNTDAPVVYTFLATLILLLGVSAAIVIRSLILRRRHRALVEEAIRNGTYVSPEQRRRQRRERPKLFEATLHDFDSEMDKWAGVVVRGTLDLQAIALCSRMFFSVIYSFFLPR